jgi:hypothetical protein
MLFATICFIVIYSIIYYHGRKVEFEDETKWVLKLTSVGLVLLLFFISLTVVKQTIVPSGFNPYFYNTNTNAIINKSVAFSNELVLYDVPENNDSGFWDSDTGKLSIKIDNNQIFYKATDFFTPLFRKKNAEEYSVVNLIYNTPVQDNYSIEFQNSKLSWSNFKFDAKNSTYDFTLTFKKNKLIESSCNVEDLKINKGLSLKDFLVRCNSLIDNNDSMFTEMLDWSTAISSDLYLVNSSFLTTNNEVSNLYIFPNKKIFNCGNLTIKQNDVLQLPNPNQSIKYESDYQYYVGIQNSRKTFKVEPFTNSDNIENLAYSHQLIFDYPAYYSLADSLPGESSLIYKTEMRFIKNRYGGIDNDSLMKSKSGYLFHENFKNNSSNSIDAYLTYKIGHPGSPLQDTIISFNNDKKVTSWIDNKDTHAFLIKSEDEKLGWIFSIKDFSKNNFSFNNILLWLSLIVIFIVSILIFLPTVSPTLIETPLYLTLYSFIVFRLLLLWRVVTFPPMENIGQMEFNSILNADYFIINSHIFPIPVTILFTILFFLFVIYFKLNNEKRVDFITDKFKFKNKKYNGLILKNVNSIWKSVAFHSIVLFVCGVLFKSNVGGEMLSRVSSIYLPIISYLLFVHQTIKEKLQFVHKGQYEYIYWNRFPFIRDFIRFWVETPVFFLSAITFVYLAFADSGFAVLFMFFLLLKNIFVNFSRKSFDNIGSIRTLFNPKHFWIYSFISASAFLYIVSAKSFFYDVFQYKYYIISAVILLAILLIYSLSSNKKYNKVSLLVLTSFLVLINISDINSYLERKIETSRIQNVIYRTQILDKKTEDILFTLNYHSNRDQKLIETVTNHWFINNYMNYDADDEFKFNHPPINVRPHFSTGVDFITQTRDIVLARYVISEFGSLTLLFLLILICIPVILFYIFHKLSNQFSDVKSQFISSSFNVSNALILLLTLGLFVWLTSTNRIVFFGQDFPFLSLTSKLSVLLPLTLILIPFIQEPEKREVGIKNINIYKKIFLRISFLSILVLSAIFLSKSKSNFGNSSGNWFRINYAGIKSKVVTYNKKFREYQTSLGELYIPTDSIKPKGAETLKNFLNSSNFISEDSTSNEYLASIFSYIKKFPLSVFSISSPIYLEYDDDFNTYNIKFNDNFNVEEPPYKINDKWKGDIFSETEIHSQLKDSVYYINNSTFSGPVYFMHLPENIFPIGTEPKGLLVIQSNTANQDIPYVSYFSYSKKNLINIKDDYTRIIDKEDLIFVNQSNSKGEKMTLISSNQCFAKNYIINGRQRFIYPLGSKFPWITNWANVCNYKVNDTSKNLSLNKSYSVTLDFELTKKVAEELSTIKNTSLKQSAQIYPGTLFSVVALDGDGNIRLMNDFAKERIVLDPNNQQDYYDKQKEELFYVNRTQQKNQWGNINLIKMNHGPGSSIKPIVVAAVASRVNAGWQNLELSRNYNPVGKTETNFYAGLKFNKPWEDEKISGCDFKRYLSISDNWYHSLIMFLGSYTRDDFPTNNLNDVLKTKSGITNPKTQQFDSASLFPSVKFNNQEPLYFPSILIDSTKWPVSNSDKSPKKLKYFANPKSLLTTGLNQYFNLKSEVSASNYNSDENKVGFSNIDPNFDSSILKFPFAYPDYSNLKQADREMAFINRRTDFKLNFENPVHGGAPYEITPLNMAEMYGRLLKMTPYYYANIDSINNNKSNSSLFDNTNWTSDNFEKTFLQESLLSGMEECIKSGTAKYLGEIKLKYKDLFFYAKTGTIGTKNRTEERNSKRLALIISNKDLIKTPLKNVKFYTIIFTVNNAEKNMSSGEDWYIKYYIKTLKLVLESNSFKNYMN